jgi:hypothetical protein
MTDTDMDGWDVKIAKDLFLAASQYCTFAENIQAFDPEHVQTYLAKILPLMYLKALLIPDKELEDHSALEQIVTEEQYEILRLEMGNKLSQTDFFSIIDPINGEVVTCSLSEALADLYQEMKNFMWLFSSPKQSSQEAAVWLCRCNFTRHWGAKLLYVLQHLHNLLFTPDCDEAEI